MFLFCFLSFCKLLQKCVLPMCTAQGAICQGRNRRILHIDRNMICQQKINSGFVFIANTIDCMKPFNCFFCLSPSVFTLLTPWFSFLLITKLNEIYNNYLCKIAKQSKDVSGHCYFSSMLHHENTFQYIFFKSQNSTHKEHNIHIKNIVQIVFQDSLYISL